MAYKLKYEVTMMLRVVVVIEHITLGVKLHVVVVPASRTIN